MLRTDKGLWSEPVDGKERRLLRVVANSPGWHHERVVSSTRSAALRAAISTGSHTGANGGAYDRSSPLISSTVMWFQIATASASMRLAAFSRPTICAPSSLPERRSTTSLVCIRVAPG
jgi:hypothetical protein